MVIQLSYLKHWPHRICGYGKHSLIMLVHSMTLMFLTCICYSMTCITGPHQILPFKCVEHHIGTSIILSTGSIRSMFVLWSHCLVQMIEKGWSLRGLKRRRERMLNERLTLLKNVGIYLNTLHFMLMRRKWVRWCILVSYCIIWFSKMKEMQYVNIWKRDCSTITSFWGWKRGVLDEEGNNSWRWDSSCSL